MLYINVKSIPMLLLLVIVPKFHMNCWLSLVGTEYCPVLGLIGDNSNETLLIMVFGI